MQKWCPVEKSQQETEERADKVVCDIFPIPLFTLCVYLEPSLPPPALASLHTSHSTKFVHPNHVLPLCTSFLSLSHFFAKLAERQFSFCERKSNALTKTSDLQQVVCL